MGSAKVKCKGINQNDSLLSKMILNRSF